MASSEAVTTQVYCVCVPSRSPMIVGSAVETIVVLTIATKSADMSPMRTSTISLWDISACCGRVPTVVVSDMGVLAGVTGGFVQVDGEVLDHRRGAADLVEVPVAEPFSQGEADGLARLDEPLTPLRGDRDELGATVLGIGAPGDQVEPGEGDQLSADHRGVDVERGGDLAGPGAPPGLEHAERDDVAPGQVLRRVTPVPGARLEGAAEAHQTVEESLDGLDPVALDGGVGHGPSLEQLG